MNKVEIVVANRSFKGREIGTKMMVSAREAKLLVGIRRATYATRDMVAVAPKVLIEQPLDLEAMNKQELHALAKRLGVHVHHMAGEVKVREALIASGKVAKPE